MNSYTELLKSEAKKDFFNFLDFINKLNNGMLFNFIEDILTENHENIRPAFPPFKGVYTDDLAFQAIREMPYATFQKIQTYIENIFSFAVDNKYPNSEKVIDNIIALTARRKQGLNVLYIRDLLQSPSVSNELKTNLGILLSKIENTVPLSFWDTEVNYANHPYLIPAYVSAYKNTEPIKGLGILKSVKQKPTDYSYYRKSISTSLENILIRERNFTGYIALLDKMPEWIKSEFDSVIANSLFQKHRITEEISAIKSRKKEIKIGISLFPDLLLIDYAYKLGFFSGDKNYSYNIKIVDWNNIFNLLMDDDLDFVIANREICSEENATRKFFKFISPLIEYKGFSIVFQNDFSISDFKTVKTAVNNEDENAAIKKTLLQLKRTPKIKIFASKNTDHYNTLLDTLSLVGLTDSDVTIVSDKEPHDGYQLFVNREVDAIVGGLPQRLLAIKNGGKELITQSDCNLPFTQVNGLICKTSREKELEPSADKIIHEWNRIVNEIRKHRNKLSDLIKLYNETLSESEPVYNPIDEGMFNSYWERTYFIPSTENEVKTLSTDVAMKQNQQKLKQAIKAIQA